MKATVTKVTAPPFTLGDSVRISEGRRGPRRIGKVVGANVKKCTVAVLLKGGSELHCSPTQLTKVV